MSVTAGRERPINGVPLGSGRRIDEHGTLGLRHFGQRRRFDAAESHQMKDAPAIMEEVIGDDPPMTAPPDSSEHMIAHRRPSLRSSSRDRPM